MENKFPLEFSLLGVDEFTYLKIQYWIPNFPFDGRHISTNSVEI